MYNEHTHATTSASITKDVTALLSNDLGRKLIKSGYFWVLFSELRL